MNDVVNSIGKSLILHPATEGEGCRSAAPSPVFVVDTSETELTIPFGN
jgi:hypothetical protein